MQGELARDNAMLGDALLEQRLEQSCTFGVSDVPSDHTRIASSELLLKV
jgi:hypothetical protein